MFNANVQTNSDLFDVSKTDDGSSAVSDAKKPYTSQKKGRAKHNSVGSIEFV